MAIDFVVEFCHREKTGIITMRVSPIVDGAKWDKSIEVQGATADALDAALRPKLLAAVARYEKAEALKQLAQQRLTALKTELGIRGE
ncbi:MAG TPA: hypothetical protein DCZ95_12570 [Verrucomicrobia bacterium]|nr:hypothetical protein [Verrucomicrobiota bacterium]